MGFAARYILEFLQFLFDPDIHNTSHRKQLSDSMQDDHTGQADVAFDTVNAVMYQLRECGCAYWV